MVSRQDIKLVRMVTSVKGQQAAYREDEGIMPLKLSQLSEDEILNLVYDGNKRAYGELYDRYLNEIYRYLYYRVARDQLEAEDLTQEVFIRAWNVLSQTRQRKKRRNFRALIYKIAHNLSVDRWRTRKNEGPLQDDDLGVNASDLNTPEKSIMDQERNEALAEAIRELEPQLQNVFICRFISGLSHAETAQSLGIKEGHVRVLQYRALKKIRISLD